MEIWDLYNENREIVGEHIRGQELPDNCYHLVVHVWIKNRNGDYLISQRSPNRERSPLMWETVGGSALKGESSIQAALREVKEEVGIDLDMNDGTLAFSEIRKTIDGEKFNDILDVWIFNYEGEVNLINATTNEVAQVKWLNPDTIIHMLNNGKNINTLDYFNGRILLYNIK